MPPKRSNPESLKSYTKQQTVDQCGESEENLTQEGNEEDGKTLLEEELWEG